MKKIVLIVSTLSFIGCIEVQDAKQKPKESPVVSEISYRIESLPEAQKYRIQFDGVDIHTRIIRLANKTNQRALEVEKFEDVVSEDGPVAYHVLDKGHEQIITVDVSKDFVVDGDYVLKNDDLIEMHSLSGQYLKLNVSGRLYFKSGSRMITEGRVFQIEVGQIYSEGGRIVTWLDEATAQGADPGQSGGRIHLKASELVGSLHFEMRVQNGSTGERWFSTNKGPAQIYNHGTNGGNSGVLNVEIENLNAGRITADFVFGKGGIGEPIFSLFGPRDIIKPSMGNGQDGLIEKACLIVKNECQDFR